MCCILWLINYYNFSQNRDYFALGAYAAMSVTQGGPGFPVLADADYQYFVTGKTTNLHIPSEFSAGTAIYFLTQFSNLHTKGDGS